MMSLIATALYCNAHSNLFDYVEMYFDIKFNNTTEDNKNSSAYIWIRIPDLMENLDIHCPFVFFCTQIQKNFRDLDRKKKFI